MGKINEHERPLQTSSAADYIKRWIDDDDDDGEDTSESESEEKRNERSGRLLGQDGRV